MKKSILLIGDTIIDRYHYLKPVGLSLESPTLKCNKLSVRNEYGGAANVAKMLSSLGCQVDFFTSIATESLEDLQSYTNCKIIQAADVSQLKERFYITKVETYKYLQVNDCNIISDISFSLDTTAYDMIVVSDYRLGILQKNVLDSLPKDKTICQMQISDSKETLEKFVGFHAVVGNNEEIPQEEIKEISKSLKLKTCVSTNGDKDVAYFYDGRQSTSSPQKISNVKDYHGAGDAFYAGFCAAYDFSPNGVKAAVISGISAAQTYLLRMSNVK